MQEQKDDIYLMREGLEDSFDILILQNKILQIMKYIHDFCEEHKIEYCLMGGTALGSKRHGGFIPWDDDLDIFMTAKEYEKFRDCFQKYGDKKRFYLQEQGAIGGYVRRPKLRMNDTAYVESGIENLKMHHGIFVDIFILHSTPDSRFKQRWQYLWAKYIVAKALANQHYKKQNNWKVQLFMSLMRLTPKMFLIKHAYKELYKYDKIDTKYVCHFVGKPMFHNGLYERAEFFPAKKVPFETLEFYAPAQLERFLEERYGDYMKIPSMEKIRYDQHALVWDVNKGFEHYVNKEKDYSDEALLI